MEEMKPKDTYTYKPLTRRIRQAAQSVGDHFHDEVKFSPSLHPFTHSLGNN